MLPAYSRRKVLLTGIPLLALVFVLGYVRQQGWGQVLPGYEVSRQTLQQQVVASGTVSSQALARIGSELTGVLKARLVREGDKVKAGDLLLQLHDEEQQAGLGELQAALQELIATARPQADAALREAQSAYDISTAELKRREVLFSRQQLSEEQLGQARTAEASSRAALDTAQLQVVALAPDGSKEQQLRQRLAVATATLEKTRIRARVSGTVQTRNVEPGDLVQPGRTLLEITTELSREILVPVDEQNMSELALGQSALIIADAYPDRVLAATVSFIAPAVDTSRGTINVHLNLDQDADFLLQGMTVTATIITAFHPDALVLPNEALYNRKGNTAEILRVRNHVIERVAVKIGLRGNSVSEILGAVAAGDKVLSTPADVGSRARVQLASSGQH